MEERGSSGAARAEAPAGPAPRYIFRIDSDSEGAVIRIVDTLTDTVWREVTVAEFVAFARTGGDVAAFFFGNAGDR